MEIRTDPKQSEYICFDGVRRKIELSDEQQLRRSEGVGGGKADELKRIISRSSCDVSVPSLIHYAVCRIEPIFPARASDWR